MKSLALALTLLTATAAHASEMDYVAFALNLDAVKALKTVFPVCENPVVKAKQVQGLTHFTITQACKTGEEVETGTPNKSVDLIITGTSAPWGEIGDVEVKVSSFCAGNCEI